MIKLRAMRTVLIVLFLSLLTACAPGVTPTPVGTEPGVLEPEPSETSLIPTVTSLPTSTVVPAIATTLPATGTNTPLPTETPLPACITLIYEEYAQFEIINSAGQRILLDVFDPEKLSQAVSSQDVLLTTHTHWDHWNEEFQLDFPGGQLFVETGMLEVGDTVIKGIASAHNAGDSLEPEGGTNYIYRIDVGGMRIVHFGDIGQNALSDEQLAALGRVDIALTQLNNPFSEMNVENRKGFNLMSQLQPRLIIPTHINLDATKQAVSEWPGFYLEASSVQICESDFSPGGPQILLMGEAAKTMPKYVELTEWESQ